MTDRDAVEAWVRRYLVAWDSNEQSDIQTLFTDDAEYRFSPDEPPFRGVDAISAEWLNRADSAGDHRFTFEVIGVDGDRAFVQGHTDYDDGDVYENLWVLDLDADGRARSMTEWFMTPKPTN